MYNPTTRLLTILELLQSRNEVSGHELAQILEVEERSIRRYIMMLRDIGIPIEGTRGRHGGYTLQRGFRLPPLMFNTEEIVAVIMGLMLMRESRSMAASAVESAQAKIERVLPETLRHAAQAMHRSLNVKDVRGPVHTISSASLVTVSLAIHEQVCLHIVYRSGEAEETERIIAPYGLVLHGGIWYVPAYCFLREDTRLFRLDRVKDITRSSEKFQRPIDFDARAFVLDALVHLPGTHLFEVLFNADLATVEASLPPGLAMLESRGEKTLMRCYSDRVDWMARGLIRLELPFTVYKTDELRDALREIAHEILVSVGPRG